jgi:hypothetical protein
MTAATLTTAPLLRQSLTLDGYVTLPAGVALAVLAGVLDGPLGIPMGILLGAGLFFVAWGAGVLYAGTRPVVNRRGAAAIAVVNLVCALDAVLIAALGIGDLTGLGTTMLLVLAAGVAGIGGLQFVGLRR